QTAILPLLMTFFVRPLVLTLVALLMIRLLRIRHPASQHAVWTMVLIGLITIPGINIMAPRFELAVLPAASGPLMNTPTQAPSAAAPGGVRGKGEVEINPLLLREQGVTRDSAPIKQSLKPSGAIATGFIRPSRVLVYAYAAGLCLVAIY